MIIFILETPPSKDAETNMQQNNYSLRNFPAFATFPRSDICSITSFTGQMNCGKLFFFDLKKSCSLELFKNGRKSWSCTECSCQTY